jgi:hypothetical protein
MIQWPLTSLKGVIDMHLKLYFVHDYTVVVEMAGMAVSLSSQAGM